MSDGWERLKNQAMYNMPLTDKEMEEIRPLMGVFIITIIVLGGLGYGIYWLFFK